MKNWEQLLLPLLSHVRSHGEVSCGYTIKLPPGLKFIFKHGSIHDSKYRHS
jgi:hypothetical protein